MDDDQTKRWRFVTEAIAVRSGPHCCNAAHFRPLTLREALEGEELRDLYQARDVIERIVKWYNTERLHSALGYQRPIDYYRGEPETLHAARRTKLAAARQRRKETNLKQRQRQLPLEHPGERC